MTRFYLTTAIDYSNGEPHIGHAYEKVGADAIARYHRLLGEDVHFLIGMDEHGQKVAQAAAARGLTPQQQVDEIASAAEGATPEVKVKQPGIGETVLWGMQSFVGGAAIVLTLVYFLLASGENVIRKIVQSFPRLADRRRAETIALWTGFSAAMRSRLACISSRHDSSRAAMRRDSVVASSSRRTR